MQVKVTRVSRKDTDKDGIKLVDKKTQKPYWKIGIQVEGSDEWYSGFANSTTDPRYLMEEGGTYSIAVESKVVGDRTYKNFKMLSPEEKKVEEMEAELAELRAMKAAQAHPASGTFEPTSAQEAVTSAEEGVTLDNF